MKPGQIIKITCWKHEYIVLIAYIDHVGIHGYYKCNITQKEYYDYLGCFDWYNISKIIKN